MASAWRRVMVYLGLVDDDEYDEYEPYDEPAPIQTPPPPPRRPAVGVGAVLQALLGAHRAFGHLAQPFLQRGHGLSDPLDEVVDLVAVVAAPLLAELDVAELLGRQLHDLGC